MDLGFAQGDADAEDGAFAIGADAQGDEHGAIEHAAAMADFFVAGIEEDVGKSPGRASAPNFQIGVEPGGALADVSGADGGAAEFFEDGGDLSCGDALDIHLPAPSGAALRAKAPPFWLSRSARFGEGQLESLLAADALFEGRGVELDLAADLRDGKSDVAEAGLESLGFVCSPAHRPPYSPPPPRPLARPRRASVRSKGRAWRTWERSACMASLTRRRRPSAKPSEPSSLRSCSTDWRS